jgi:hypothetical protein
VANQDSDTVNVLAIDPDTGLPVPTPGFLSLPTPACLKVRPRPASPPA